MQKRPKLHYPMAQMRRPGFKTTLTPRSSPRTASTEEPTPHPPLPTFCWRLEIPTSSAIQAVAPTAKSGLRRSRRTKGRPSSAHGGCVPTCAARGTSQHCCQPQALRRPIASEQLLAKLPASRSPTDNFAAAVGHSCLALPPLQLVEYGPAGAPSLNFSAHWARLPTEWCCNIAEPMGQIAPGRTAERAPTLASWLRSRGS